MPSWQAHVTSFMLKVSQAGNRPVALPERPALWRARMDRFCARLGTLPDTTKVSPVTGDTVRGFWLETPQSRVHRVILYLHGGCYVYGSPASHAPLAARLAQGTGARVLTLDYRLAPEHAYPAALEDAMGAYLWLLEGGIRPGEIVLAGDSAGGGLAVAMMMALRDRNLPQPAGAALLSPWLDLALTGRSIHAHSGEDRTMSVEMLACCAHLYLGKTSPTDPLVSPLYGDCRGLAPLFVQVSEREMLADDGRRFTSKAVAAGVDVTFDLVDGALHVPALYPSVPEGRGAALRAAHFIAETVRNETLWIDEMRQAS